MIRNEFFNAVNSYALSPDTTSKLWQEIERQYSEPSRHYHTMVHLQNLISELLPVQSRFKNWNVVVFAVVYHDVIYKASKSNNEEKSADLAVERLSRFAVPEESIVRCKEFILATKKHQQVDDEIDLFTDADLSILGSSTESYRMYTNQIRKEYSIYPDLLYKPGRKKVLLHFLGMQNIFKSEFFRYKYESSARRNLENELGYLGG
jgi:predicted metal-dependent HD superfamily phosphohydrolase